jgi:hypothetical protein
MGWRIKPDITETVDKLFGVPFTIRELAKVLGQTGVYTRTLLNSLCDKEIVVESGHSTGSIPKKYILVKKIGKPV